MIEILSANPYSAYKHAIQIALGGKGVSRPVFKERDLYGFKFQDDVEDYVYTFGELNYKFIEELPVSDPTVYTVEDFGKFFYEYGRVILGNLMICLTKADWNSIAQGSSTEATYVSNYLNSLITLDNHVDTVVEEFKKTAIDNGYGDFPLDYKYASKLIQDYKEEVSKSRYSKDMKNTEIFYISYIGLLFTLYGLFLLLPGINGDVDVFSFLKAPSSSSMMNLYQNILTKDYGDDDVTKKFITLTYVFYKSTDFLRLVSGLADMDPLIGTMYDVSKNFVSKIDAEDDESANAVRNLIDPEIGDVSLVGSGLTLQSFTSIYDPILDILSFRNGGIIPKDNCNIWAFGDVYIKGYKYELEEVTESGTEYKTISEIINPIMSCYMGASMKSSYTNEDVERAFMAVSNLVTLVDEDVLTGVNPGLILQATIMAAAFRILESRTTSRSASAKAKINGAIDILDMFIYKLYDLWFKSGKFFKQPSRPRYGNTDSCNETLTVLKNECDQIIFNYLEFVRFGINKSESDKILLKTIKNKRILTISDEHLNEFISELFDNPDEDTFIRLCAVKEGRSIVQSLFVTNAKFEFANLINVYARKELLKSYISMMAVEPERHTGVSILDRVIDASIEAKSSTTTNPETYCVGVYGVIWCYLENVLRKHNIGNYFDFGNAGNSLNDYTIEHVVAESVGKPLKGKIDFVSL